MIQSVIPPARKNPAIQIAFVPGARRERLASLIFTNQLLEPVMSDQFGNRDRPAILGKNQVRERAIILCKFGNPRSPRWNPLQFGSR